jgi:Gram-negative bacterial TonB protein C-terminal
MIIGIARARRAAQAAVTALVGGALLFAAAPPAAAQNKPVPAEAYRIRAREIERLLRDDRPAKASRAARRAVDDLVPNLAGGADDADLLGNFLLLEALSRSALGYNADALWLWSLAQGVDPALKTADLSRFGAPARVLSERPLREPAEDGQIATEAEAGNRPGVFDRASKATPPRVVKLPDAEYSKAARGAGLKGPVILQVLLDRQGQPRYPLVIESPAAVLTYTAAAAVLDGRYEPARLDGEPVAVYYDIRIDFTP